MKADIEYLKKVEFEQLSGSEWHEIYNIQQRLLHARYDQLSEKDYDRLQMAKKICEILLKNARVWKVEYRVMKGRDGKYENGGQRFFWTEEEAQDFITDFKKHNDGWTDAIDEPEEVDLEEVDLENAEIE